MNWQVTEAPLPTGAAAGARSAKWVQAGVYLLILFGCTLVWMLEYDIPKIPHALLGAALGAGLSIAVYLLPRRAALRLAAAGGLAWGALLLMTGRIAAGAAYASALIYSRFTEVFHNLYAPVAPPASPAGLAAFGVLLVFAGSALAALLGLAVLRARSFWLSFAVCAPLFWFAYAKDGMPPVFPTLMLFCGWCALLLKGDASRLRPRQSALMQMAAAALCFVVMGSTLAVFNITGYQKNTGVVAARSRLDRIRASFESAFQTGTAAELLGDFGIGYGTGTVGSRSVTRVNLAKSGQLGFGSGNAFTVTGLAGNTGIHYLRGFSCDVYTGTSWQQSDAADYPFEQGAFQPLTFDPYYAADQGPSPSWSGMYDALYYNSTPSQQAVTVTYTETPRYIHTPYALTAVAGDGEQVAFARDAYLAPTGAGTSFEVYQDFYGNAAWILSQPSYPAPSDSSGFGAASSWWTETLPRNTQTAEEEAEYRAFIEEHYTQLPDGLGEQLRDFAAWFGLQPAASDADWQQLAYYTGQLLRGFGTYTLSPGQMPAGSDFVTYFLRESQTGYCVHYASAGVALLRALGVPARYVEGYVVGTGGLDSDDVVAVPNKNSHAWVEVWHPDYGWLPLEVTPGGADSEHPATPEVQNPGAAQESDTSASEAPASSSTPQASSSAASQSDAAPGGAAGAAGGIGAGPVLTVAGGALVLAALLALPGLVRKRRFRRFSRLQGRAAILSMYRYLERLEYFGYPPKDEMLRLAEKARFSQHTPEAAEHRRLLAEAERARAGLMRTLPPFRRLWLYLRGL